MHIAWWALIAKAQRRAFLGWTLKQPGDCFAEMAHVSCSSLGACLWPVLQPGRWAAPGTASAQPGAEPPQTRTRGPSLCPAHPDSLPFQGFCSWLISIYQMK